MNRPDPTRPLPSFTAYFSESMKDKDIKCWHNLYSSLQCLRFVIDVFDSLDMVTGSYATEMRCGVGNVSHDSSSASKKLLESFKSYTYFFGYIFKGCFSSSKRYWKINCIYIVFASKHQHCMLQYFNIFFDWIRIPENKLHFFCHLWIFSELGTLIAPAGYIVLALWLTALAMWFYNLNAAVSPG